MKITILCVGKLKENYFAEAAAEYIKRLQKYCVLHIIEVADEKTGEKMSDRESEIVKNKEGVRLEKYLSGTAFKVALAIDGKQLSSEGFADFFGNKMTGGCSDFIFVIGGSVGLSQSVLSRCDFYLSFSKMTFPHQLMRVILLEQVYRSFRILGGEPYHR